MHTRREAFGGNRRLSSCTDRVSRLIMVVVLVVVGMLVKLQAVDVSVDVDVDLDRWRLDIVRGRRHTRPGQSKNSAKVCDTARCRVAVQCCAMLCYAVRCGAHAWFAVVQAKQ